MHKFQIISNKITILSIILLLFSAINLLAINQSGKVEINTLKEGKTSIKEHPQIESTPEKERAIIKKYETEHPIIAKRFNSFISSGFGTLSSHEIRRLKVSVYSAKEPYRSIYLNNLDKYKFISKSIFKGGKYIPIGSGIITIGEDYHTKNIIVHECAHAIDRLSNKHAPYGWETTAYKFHDSKTNKTYTLTEAIEYDIFYNTDNPHSVISLASGKDGNIKKVVHALKTGSPAFLNSKDRELYGSVISNFQKSLKKHHAYYLESITDIYGGATKNAMITKPSGKRIGCFHENIYWSKPTKNQDLAKEMWSEYFQHCTTDEYCSQYTELTEEYFPTASKGLDMLAQSLGSNYTHLNEHNR